MSDPVDWLSMHGDLRRHGVEQAATQLLDKYRSRWPKIVPPELHRLAASLSARIVAIDNLEGDARLVPAFGGFVVLVQRELASSRYGRFRTCIAHELVHTLFYSKADARPRRLCEPSKAEEYFCFDVARRVLAPHWLLEATGVRTMSEAEPIFRMLVETFKLSRPVAARVMLEDYELVRGIAGRWSRQHGRWELNRGSTYATPLLTEAERKTLRQVTREWLESAAEPATPHCVIGTIESSGDSAFVVVEARCADASTHGSV